MWGLEEALQTRVLGRAHEHHGSLASTNDRAAAWLREGGPHGLVVTAETQTAGRGRNGRVWSSPPGGNLYASVGLRVASPRRDLSALGLIVGLGLYEGLGSIAGLGLKWPNDLMVGERKLAGVLCESRWGEQVEVVVGFGINLRREGIDPAVAEGAVALDELGLSEGRGVLLGRLLGSLERRLDAFLITGFEDHRDAYEAANVQLRRRVRVESGDTVFVGEAKGVDESGALIVGTETGDQVVQVGDVTRAR